MSFFNGLYLIHIELRNLFPTYSIENSCFFYQCMAQHFTGLKSSQLMVLLRCPTCTTNIFLVRNECTYTQLPCPIEEGIALTAMILFIYFFLQVLRDCFNYKPPITKEQFFSAGFVEKKVIMCTEILQVVRNKHQVLKPKDKVKVIGPSTSKQAQNASTNKVSNIVYTEYGVVS